MKNIIASIIIVISIFYSFFSFQVDAKSLADNLSGKILIQVEKNGEAWYVFPNNKQRYFLGSPADALQIMKQLGLGISETDYYKLKGYGKQNLSGKIILRVQASGEAYYVNPSDLKLHYLGRPFDAFQIMKKLGLGITNKDLSQIPISLNSKSTNNIVVGSYNLNYAPKISNNNTKGLNLAVCLINWSDSIKLPTINYLKDFFSNANDFYNELSLGNSYFKNIQIAYAPQLWPEKLPALFNEEDKIGVQLCDPLIDFSSVDALIIFPSAVVGRGGASIADMLPLITAEKNIDSRILVGHYDKTNGYINHLSNDEYGWSVITHELAHTKLFSSVGHDNSLECGPDSFNPKSCSIINYGNPFSTMSNGSGHFSSWLKYLSGPWIKQTSVSQSGIYQLSQTETPSDTPQLLRIPSNTFPVCVEYRKPIGIDKQFSATNMSKLGYNGNIPDDGCLFISICPDKNYSSEQLTLQKNNNYLLDTTPASQINSIAEKMSVAEKANFYDIYDSCLTSGKVFNNSSLGVKISWNKTVDDKTASVQIDLQ